MSIKTKPNTTSESQHKFKGTEKTRLAHGIIAEGYVKKRVSVDPSLFAFVSKGNNHCPS